MEQHLFDLVSPTTSPVFPVNRLTVLFVVELISLSGKLLTGLAILFISLALFLICALCFFKSANVPFIVTNTVTFILPLASVVYVVSFSLHNEFSENESLSLPSGAFRFSVVEIVDNVRSLNPFCSCVVVPFGNIRFGSIGPSGLS